MSTTGRYWIAFLIGAVLLAGAVFLTGVLAALPLPAALFLGRTSHDGRHLLGFIAMIYAIPVVVMAIAVGWAVQRWLGNAPRLLAVCALPWLLYVIYGSVDYVVYCGLPWRTALIYLFGWYSWPGVLSVPAGLFCSRLLPQPRRAIAH